MAEAERSPAAAAPSGSAGLRRLRLLLTQVSPSTAFALRFAIAVSAAIWIGHLPGLATNSSQWILITVLMVAQPQAGGSLAKGALRALGTALAAFTAILLFGAFAQDPPWLLAGLFLVHAVAGYGFSGPRYSYAWFVWAFTTAVVVGNAVAGQGEVETIAFQRASMVGIGILIVFLVDAIFWPTRSEEKLRASLGERARALAQTLRRSIQALLEPRQEGVGDAATASPLASQLGLAEAAHAESGVSGARLEALSRVALVLEGLASRERILRGSEEQTREGDADLAASLSELARCVEASLAAAAEALAAERPPRPLGDELGRALVRLEEDLARASLPSARVEGHLADLRDLVWLLRRLEEVLAGLAPHEAPSLSAAPRSFQLDPFRVQLGLRAATATCAALLGVLVLDWPMDTTVAPVAFMVAATPTRGATLQTLLGLAVVLLLGWLIADLSIVFALPTLGRVPEALVLPFAVAGGLAWLSTKRPPLAILPAIGGLLAIVPVFAGMRAPTDVYGPYNTMCYLALAIGVGFAATRLLWPATAAALFRQRAGGQLQICIDAFRERRAAQDAEARRRAAAGALGVWTRQTAALARLHGQAAHEPVERGLDEPRRSAWIALAQDVFDGVLATGGRAARPSGGAPAAASALLAAMDRVEDVLLSSMQDLAETLRGGREAAPGRELPEAQRLMEQAVEAVRGVEASGWALAADERADLLRRIDGLRRLCARQLALERWCSEWLAAPRA